MKPIEDIEQDLLPEYRFDYSKAKPNRFAIKQSPIKITKNLLDYYFKFKDLVILHRQLGFGKNLPLPEVFTQNICRELYGLTKWETTKADAKDSYGKAIEIKATGSKSGTTTIDINAITELGELFSGLFWMYFDFDNDEIEISFIEAEKLKNIEPDKKNSRNNISLKDFVDKTSLIERYHLEFTGLTKK